MSTATDQQERIPAPGARPTASGKDERPTRTNRLLLGLVAVLTAAVLGLATWIVVDDGPTSEAAVTEEIQQLLDDYHDAWNARDGDAYRALVTDGGIFVMAGRTTPAEQQAAYIERLGSTNWHVEPLGEPIMSGDGPWFVAQANRLTADTYPDEGYQGVSVVTVVDDDGTLRIARHEYVGRS